MNQISDVYILDARQISVQQPLSDEWMDKPLLYSDSYVRAIDPDYKQFFPANTVRRLGKILKRAMLTSKQVIEATGIQNPEAIITGTGFGCVENTELFLESMVNEGEEFLKPTSFMQSTHNTISSLIAIDTGSHGYNSTYTQKGISFDLALLDAFVQLKGGLIKNALVGAHDEVTPTFNILMQRIIDQNTFCSEASVSMMLASQKPSQTSSKPSQTSSPTLGAKPNDSMCKIENIKNIYRPDLHELQITAAQYSDVDAIMVNSEQTAEISRQLFPNKKLLKFSHLFGQSFSVSGLGIYAAAICLKQNRIPAHFFIESNQQEQKDVRNILFYNQYENKNHTFILLSCGN